MNEWTSDWDQLHHPALTGWWWPERLSDSGEEVTDEGVLRSCRCRWTKWLWWSVSSSFTQRQHRWPARGARGGGRRRKLYAPVSHPLFGTCSRAEGGFVYGHRGKVRQLFTHYWGVILRTIWVQLDLIVPVRNVSSFLILWEQNVCDGLQDIIHPPLCLHLSPGHVWQNITADQRVSDWIRSFPVVLTWM